MISIFIAKFFSFFIPLLICIAFLTLLERKIIASLQQRKGPNFVGFLGLLQPIADGLKLITKESIFPSVSHLSTLLMAPLLIFFCAISVWFVIPFTLWSAFVDFEYNVWYVLMFSSLSVYGIILAGWASNSKYAFLGALRGSAQMISYEVSLSLIILHVVVFTKSFNLFEIIEFQKEIWFFVPLFPSFLLFFISALAETNRTPFDLAEAEGELVAGYNVEYSAVTFAVFFLAEYSNIIFMSVMTVILFFGGWDIKFIIGLFWDFLDFYNSTNTDIELFLFKNKDCWLYENSIEFFALSAFFFALKIIFFATLFIVVRATYPRFRYDHLMNLGWKNFLPLSLGLLVLNFSISLYYNGSITFTYSDYKLSIFYNSTFFNNDDSFLNFKAEKIESDYTPEIDDNNKNIKKNNK